MGILSDVVVVLRRWRKFWGVRGQGLASPGIPSGFGVFIGLGGLVLGFGLRGVGIYESVI